MERDKSIDICKGIGVILMVLGHAGMPYSSVVFRFHMALFFITSGWCFSDKYLENGKTVLNLIWRKLKGLYIPFVIFNGMTTLLKRLFIRLNIYTNNPLFLEAPSIGGGYAYGIFELPSSEELKMGIREILKFMGETQLGGATWFLRVMFGVSVFWCLLNWLLKSVAGFQENMRLGINIVLSVFLMFVSWQWMKDGKALLFMQFETVASAYIMFCSGYYLKRYYKKYTVLQNVFIFIISFIILMYCDNICRRNAWNSNVNMFDSPYMYVISSYVGFFTVYALSQILTELRIVKDIFGMIGRHTLSVLLYHFLSFKLVTYVQCIIYGAPSYRLASFPIWISSGKWWIVYGIVGVVVPICIALVYDKIKFFLCKKMNIYKRTDK